jgi:hypothetical protein
MGLINETHQFDKNAIEIDMDAPHSEIKSIVNLIRELVKLVRISIKVKHPWNEQKMKLMLDNIVQLFGYQTEQIEGIICLAETNLYYYPSAFVICRTVIEINILLEWLLDPEEESKRILRYIHYLKVQLAHIKIYNDFRLESTLPMPDKENEINNHIREMTQVAEQYGVSPESVNDLKPRNFPSIMENMVKDISPDERQNRLKLAYYSYSKFTHAMLPSINRYNNPNFLSYVPVLEWHCPLFICYESIIAITQKLSKRFTVKSEEFDINLEPILVELVEKMNKTFSPSSKDSI